MLQGSISSLSLNSYGGELGSSRSILLLQERILLFNFKLQYLIQAFLSYISHLRI